MKFTYYGHSCFLVEVNGKKLLFDPFISGNELAKDININQIEADYILVSHGHMDHILDLVPIASRTKAKVICSWEIYVWLGKQGIDNVHPMNTGGKWDFDFGTVKCVVAHHSSGLPDGTYGGNPLGFIITSTEKNFYYSGDTALTLDMQLIPQWTTLDFAVMPIGDNFTMGPSDAIKAAQMTQCKTVLGVHYDTFGFIKINHKDTNDLFTKNDIKLLLPQIGETISI
jgi:L-ascorbate metabolism protein UlaG (beta-lactamase superfamily)